jgi:polyferredoxin
MQFRSLACAALTGSLLAAVQLKTDPPLLLLERFLPGAGWAEVVLLSLYAGWIASRMADPNRSPRWRRRIWALFSVVFFAQLGLGLLGFERLLQTGKLHLPIPALVAAGPVYRGGGFYMLAIYGATLLVVGRAWCSHLCYIGAWDHAASRRKDKPKSLPPWRGGLRLALLIFVLASALAMNLAGLSPATAAVLAGAFGLVGLGLMIFVSSRVGQMVHCTAFCPLGALTSALGWIHPFRIGIDSECTECGRCRGACRYDALGVDDLKRRRPALSCTLCGDCVSECREGFLAYRFPFLGPAAARSLFLVLAVTLHALFLAVAPM